MPAQTQAIALLQADEIPAATAGHVGGQVSRKLRDAA